METLDSGRSKNSAGESLRSAGARMIYPLVVDPECSFPKEPLVTEMRSQLDNIAFEREPTSLDDLKKQAEEWARAAHLRCVELFRDEAAAHDSRVLARRAGLGCAPISLMAGAWLQWLTNPGTYEDDTALRTLALYAGDVGAGRPMASRGNAYLGLLRNLQISEYAEPVARLAADSRIPEWAFDFPALLLLMSRKPEDFYPEIMGADLCLRTVGLLPVLAAVRETECAVADWDSIDLNSTRGGAGESPSQQSADIIELLVRNGVGENVDRVQRGFRWALENLRTWNDHLVQDLENACHPAFEMAELLRSRAREAYVYHHEYKLEGKSLSEWFSEARSDPHPMLNAIANSRLVRAGLPEASPLVTSLVAENGRMFRVFTENDLKVIRRWITSLPSAENSITTTEVAIGADSFGVSGLFAPVEPGQIPKDLREAYHLLQSRTDTVAVRTFALDYVQQWLARSAANEVPLPERWDPVGLRPWLLEQHDRAALEFEEEAETANSMLPTREQLIETSVQMAPMILIDGGWLQGFTDYTLASTEIGFSLFATYWDELGNSELSLNHPLIYRELLDEMGVQLPPTGSREFIDWSRFLDSSFAFPVYWLSISRFPQTFLPELLGMNLAIELTGVGGMYRKLHNLQSGHGFSTRFIDIHSTIDNVSTGHSAWASDAIDIFLSSITRTEGADGAAVAWQRVRNGYAALNPADMGA